MNTKVAIRFGAALLATVLVGAATEAHARWVRQSASVCWVHDSAGADRTTYNKTSGYYNPTTGGSLEMTFLRCPIVDDDRFPKGAIRTLNLHGRVPTGTFVNAQTCNTFWHSVGGSCSSSVITGAAGDYTLSPPLTAWSSPTNDGDFGFIALEFSQASTSGSPSFRGYYVSD